MAISSPPPSTADVFEAPAIILNPTAVFLLNRDRGNLQQGVCTTCWTTCRDIARLRDLREFEDPKPSEPEIVTRSKLFVSEKNIQLNEQCHESEVEH